MVNFRTSKTDDEDRIGTFVDGYLKIERKSDNFVWILSKDGYDNYPSSHHPDELDE